MGRRLGVTGPIAGNLGILECYGVAIHGSGGPGAKLGPALQIECFVMYDRI